RQQIAFLGAASEGVDPGISPNIAAVAAELAELNVVAVGSAALLEDQDELVLAAVERAHPAVVLDPNTEIFQLAISLAAGGQYLVQVAPIHADVVDGAAGAEGGEVPAGLAEKGSEPSFIYLAHSHREGAMVDHAEAARVTLDRHVVGRVGEDHGGTFRAHQRREGGG